MSSKAIVCTTLFALVCWQTLCASAAAPPPGIVRFDRAIIVDAVGFEQPMAASTMFIPHGWQTQGGVVWGREYLCTNGYNVNWSATSPDGSTSITILPQEKWESNNYGGPRTDARLRQRAVYVRAGLSRERRAALATGRADHRLPPAPGPRAGTRRVQRVDADADG